MDTLVIIQARMGSSRLPGKVLKPLGKHAVLEYVVERCRKFGADKVIVATSSLIADQAIVKWCEEHDVPCFQGEEEDVLSRYYECALPYAPQYVIRVTADCPFVDYEMAREIQQAMHRAPSDIVNVEGELPRGLVSEMISFSALEYIYNHGQAPRHREHVTYFAYEYPDLFTRTVYQAKPSILHPQLRITLDTEEDYLLCQAVAEYFKGDLYVRSSDVVGFLLNHPEVARLNAHIEQKPVV